MEKAVEHLKIANFTLNNITGKANRTRSQIRQ